MAVNLLRLRPGIITPNLLLLRSKAFVNVKYYADDSTKKGSLYETLGIPSSATQNEIKKAYYDLTLKYHPDRNEGCDVASTKFKEVSEAYEVLGSFVMRKKYDKGIPLQLVKESMKQAPIDHKVKYQEFFDSRVVPQTFGKQAEEKDYIERSPIEDYIKYAMEKDKEFNDPKRIRITQGIIITFFSTIFFFRYCV